MAPFAQDSLFKPTYPGVTDMNVDRTLVAATGIKQGQFVKRVSDGTNLVLQPAVTNTDGPDVVGVAGFTFPMVDDPAGPEAPTRAQSPAAVATGGIHLFRGKSAQVFKPGLAVVIDDGVADGQTVRLQGADNFANVVGQVANTDQISSGTTFGVTGDATSFNVPVWIAPPGLGRNTGTASILV